MALKGMDVEGGNQCAQTVRNGAEQLEQLTQQLTQSISGFQWIGPDADRTRESWNNQYVSTLKNVANELTQMSQLITNQAREQEEVSQS